VYGFFEADGATWLTNFIDPPQNSKRASAGDLLPVPAAQDNLDANSNPPSQAHLPSAAFMK